MDFKERWRLFLSITFDPWVVLLIVLTVVLGRVLIGQSNPSTVSALIVMVSLVSGVTGAVWYNRWSFSSEERLVTARGRSAVRSLKVLLNNIGSLGRRVECHDSWLTNDDVEDHQKKLTRMALTDLRERCVALEEETLSSIENWTDFVPEADIRSQVGVISALRGEVDDQKKQAEEMRKLLRGQEDQSEADKRELREAIADKEANIKRLNSELQKKSLEFNPLYSPSIRADSSLLTSFSSLGEMRICETCGQSFFSGLSLLGKNKCPSCGIGEPTVENLGE